MQAGTAVNAHGCAAAARDPGNQRTYSSLPQQCGTSLTGDLDAPFQWIALPAQARIQTLISHGEFRYWAHVFQDCVGRHRGDDGTSLSNALTAPHFA